MNDEGPQNYDREYTDPLSDVTRVRLGYSNDCGEVTRFVMQLESVSKVSGVRWFGTTTTP